MARPKSKSPVIDEIYTVPIIAAFRKKANRRNRLDIVRDTLTPANRRFAVAKRYLSECLQFANDQDGLDADRLSRLREPKDYAEWKQVHNELLVAYFFAKVFKLKIKFTTNAPRRGLGDFLIVLPTDQVTVEVKTPRGDVLRDQSEGDGEEDCHEGLEEHLLDSVFRDAANQAQPGNKNLLVVSTRLCKWILDSRAFEKLLYGHEVWSFAVEKKQPHTARPVETEFVPDGHLLKHRGKRFTRISAVASFKEDMIYRLPVSDGPQQVHFAILHNYYAECPIPPELFPGVEQLVANKERRRVERMNAGRDGFAIDPATEIRQ
jgi:hypothetical protein